MEIRTQTHTQGRPREDTGKRRPSTRPGERPQEEPALPTPGSQIPASRTRRDTRLMFKPQSHDDWVKPQCITQSVVHCFGSSRELRHVRHSKFISDARGRNLGSTSWGRGKIRTCGWEMSGHLWRMQSAAPSLRCLFCRDSGKR